MARLFALSFATLLAGGQAVQRPEDLRKQVGECAKSNATSKGQTMFTQGRIMGSLPSAAVKQAETDVVGADLISIEYGSNYKILTEKMSKELYVLTQCGSVPPTDAAIADVLLRHAGYKVKRFTIPLQSAASDSTVHLAFFEALGVQDRISYVNKYATGPCWQKALGCGGLLNVSAHASQVDALFMDCSFGGSCTNVNGQANGVHFSASQDPGPLRSAEHIKFIAAFFNKEKLASQLFAKTVTAYTSASVSASTKPVVAWISYEAESAWSKAKFVLSQASYKLKMVSDAGGANVNGTAVQAQMGSNMSMVAASSGKTYSVMLSSFNGSKAKASAAFFAALSQVDVVIDEVYTFAPRSYTFDSFLTQMGLTKSSSLKFVKNKMVLRIDGIISENDGLDWYESRVAHPDWAVGGLARQLHTDMSKPAKYFRNIAKGEKPKVITKAMCTGTLPACNVSTYPAAIGMMIGEVTASAAATRFGLMLLCFVVVLQA